MNNKQVVVELNIWSYTNEREQDVTVKEIKTSTRSKRYKVPPRKSPKREKTNRLDAFPTTSY